MNLSKRTLLVSAIAAFGLVLLPAAASAGPGGKKANRKQAAKAESTWRTNGKGAKQRMVEARGKRARANRVAEYRYLMEQRAARRIAARQYVRSVQLEIARLERRVERARRYGFVDRYERRQIQKLKNRLRSNLYAVSSDAWVRPIERRQVNALVDRLSQRVRQAIRT